MNIDVLYKNMRGDDSEAPWEEHTVMPDGIIPRVGDNVKVGHHSTANVMHVHWKVDKPHAEYPAEVTVTIYVSTT